MPNLKLLILYLSEIKKRLYLVRAGFVKTLPSIAKPKIPKPAPTQN